MSNERTLIIIDDQLFDALKKVNPREEYFTLDPNAIRPIISNEEFVFSIQKSSFLLNILNHIVNGDFYGLTQLLVFDLNDTIQGVNLALKHKLTDQNCAILLDIYAEKEDFPAGKDLSEYLDQTPYADRIAWLSVTGRLSQEYKPYPLIRKREIPVSLNDHAQQDRPTLFLWWGWLFNDFELDHDKIDPANQPACVNYLREQRLVTPHNIQQVAEDLYRTSTKRARKGGLAGNIIKPVLWQVHDDEEKGRIVNAFLKIKATDDGGDLQTEVDFQQNNGMGIPFPQVYYHQPEFYCMEKISWTNFSDFIFEQIGDGHTQRLLSLLLGHVTEWHKAATPQPFEGNTVLKATQKIRERLEIWTRQNPFFEPLLYPKTLIINNLQYFNALYLCDRIERYYDGSIEPRQTLPVHGDLVAQNIFIDNHTDGIRVIDPRGKDDDYLTDYIKLFSSFSGQGHLEYLGKNEGASCAHFETNKGIDPNGCYYICAPSLDKMTSSQTRILTHLQQQQETVYATVEQKPDNWRARFLLGLATQYLGAPPFRDSPQFQYEMKFLYYRGVEVLNEFCERMGFIEHRARVFALK